MSEPTPEREKLTALRAQIAAAKGNPLIVITKPAHVFGLVEQLLDLLDMLTTRMENRQ